MIRHFAFGLAVGICIPVAFTTNVWSIVFMAPIILLLGIAAFRASNQYMARYTALRDAESKLNRIENIAYSEFARSEDRFEEDMDLIIHICHEE